MLERTVFKRGKSEIPESRIEMLESRRERELRREETEALREAAEDWELVILYQMVEVAILNWGWG